MLPADIRSQAASSQPNELSRAVRRYYSNKSLFPTAGRLINTFMNYMKSFQKKLMVIIDEYNNFTNDILRHDASSFPEIAWNAGGVSRFYQNLRACQQRGIIDRIFITGVLPVTLDTSLTGFVFDRLYDDHQFNELAGFTEDEIRTLLHETVDFGQCAFTPETLAEEIRKRYNGYRFAENAENTVCNPALCLGFLKQLTNRKGQKIPPLGTESGNDMDFEKLSGYLALIKEDALNSIFRSLDPSQSEDSGGYIALPALATSLKITSEFSRLEVSAGITLLYHLGFLTIAPSDEVRKNVDSYQEDLIYLRIPNRYYQELFAQFRLSRYPALFSAVRTDRWGISWLSRINDISSLSDMLTSLAGAFVRTASAQEGESQIVLTVYVALSTLAGSSFELTREYSIRHNHQYVFSNGLEENEYQEIDEAAIERELTDSGIISQPAQKDGDPPAPPAAPSKFRSRFRNRPQAASVRVRRGRADLVAENTGAGPSYLFEFKYQRDSNAREGTKERVCELLYNRAVKQLAFYATDDRLSRIPDLHKYIIMYAYGEFFLEEVP